MIVKVCDTIMGAGKTESAITLMNQDKESRYVFITPYLDEVERIKRSCSGRKFKDPQSKGKGKLENRSDNPDFSKGFANAQAGDDRG